MTADISITIWHGYNRGVTPAVRMVPLIGLAILVIADAMLYLDGSIRSSLLVGQLMMVLTVFIISFSRSKLEVDKRNLDVGNRKHFKHK